MSNSRKEIRIRNIKAVTIQEKQGGDAGCTIPSIIYQCKKRKIQPSELKEIIIGTPDPSRIPQNFSIDRGTYSFRITNAEITSIIYNIVEIASDTLKIASLLKNVDEELGRKLYSAEASSTTPQLNKLQPQYLIAGYTCWMPGPPQEGYIPAKKGKQLDQILLEREQKAGINYEGFTPTFLGLIKDEDAIPFISQGHLFSEDPHVNRFLLHGKYTHRLFFEAIRNAVDNKQLNLTISTTSPRKKIQLTEKQLLELLVKTQVSVGLFSIYDSAWNFILDQFSDSTHSFFDGFFEGERVLYSPKYYSYSCRSAESMNSILMCFGKELDLPHLQSYLLDSHYKTATMMVSKVMRATTDQDTRISFDQVYTYCMIGLATSFNDFTSENVCYAKRNERYSRYDQHPSVSDTKNIVMKKTNTSSCHGRGSYTSSEDFVYKKLKQDEQKAWQTVEEIDDGQSLSDYYYALKQRIQHEKKQETLLSYKEREDTTDSKESKYTASKTQESIIQDKLLQIIQPLIESIARSSSAQEKHQKLIQFLEESNSLTVAEMNILFILIKEIQDLNAHTAWQTTVEKIQEIAYNKLEKESQEKYLKGQIRFLEKAKSMEIFNANFYSPSFFQWFSETVRDKINKKLIELNPPSLVDVLRWSGHANFRS